MKTAKTQTPRRIEDLALRELDRIYSLARIGDWPDAEIGRVFRLSEADVRKAFDDYVALRPVLEKNQPNGHLPQDPTPDLTPKKPRKRRSDAIFATAKERQAAYRARLKEQRHADMQVPSRDPVTDPPDSVEEELSVTTVDIS